MSADYGRNGRIGRRDFLKGAAAISLVGAMSTYSCSRKHDKRTLPNLLFVFSDQHRAASMGCYGNGQIYTPNFDAFANTGVRMVNAVSNTPVCAPYRASLMTGMLSHNTGVVTNGQFLNPFRHRTIAQVFKAAGYKCGYTGKWHLGNVNIPPGPRRLGFDDYWATHYAEHTYASWTYYTDKDQVVKGEGFFRPRMETGLAIQFMKRHQENPWCLFVSWGPPHMPYAPPAEYDHYTGIELPSNVPRGLATEFAHNKLPKYYALIEGLDTEFGRLITELKNLGMAEDTIVVYTSDHGVMLGSHGLYGKRLPYSYSTDVPFLIRWPGHIREGAITHFPFGAPDIFPTLMGLTGLEIPENLDGKDYSSIFVNGHAKLPDKDSQYLSMYYGRYIPYPGWRGVRTDRYIYARTEKTPWLLYDLKNDPDEQYNLVNEKKALTKDLDFLTMELMEHYGDSWRNYPRVGDWQRWEHHPDSGPKKPAGST